MGPIILIGGTGYVGAAYKAFFEKKGIHHYVFPSRSSLKYNFLTTLEKTIEDTKSTSVFNAAGYTGKPNVDACEKEKGECVNGNVTLPQQIAEICKNKKVILGHVSSGCIYTGKSGSRGFTEKEEPNFTFRQNNCSFYSGTKALGEEVLMQYENVYVWRLRIPFNNVNCPRNYLSKLMNYETLLEAENSISNLEEFVESTYYTIEKRTEPGIYNVTNTGSVLTSKVVELIKKYNLPYNKKQYKFFASEEEFMKKAAKTPRSNCVLDNTKLLNCGIYMKDSYESIEESLRKWIL